ncbi:MAG: phosphoserine phosphatase SerB [Methanosarcinaceae archaeon]|nr:phosphoserine phosphatase SerB [Methanosarcinaceae archaeon]
MNCTSNYSRSGFAKVIVFDMDSTLIDAETIDELAGAAGVAEKVTEITNLAMNGKLDYGQALSERVNLLKGLSLKDAQEAVDKMPLMPGAKELVKYVKDAGYKTAMVSGGFTLSTDRIGKLLGMDYVFSNELILNGGHLTGEVTGLLTKQNSKEHVFEEIARQNGVKPNECVVIGDGANDVCIFKKAGYSIAFNSKEILREYADVVITQKDLKAVIPVIQALD